MNSNGQIIIGIAAPLTGNAALPGKEMKQAVELAIAEKNKKGGICGLAIGCKAYNDESRVAQGEIIAKSFCFDKDILAVIGHYDSDVSIAASIIYNRYGVTMLNPIASNPKLTEQGFDNIFRYTNRDDKTASAIAGYLTQAFGKTNAVIIEAETAYGKSMANHFKESFLRSGGTIIREYKIQSGITAEELFKGMPLSFDILFYGGSFEGALILKAMRNAGFQQLFAAGDGCWDKANFLIPSANSLKAGEGVLVLSASHNTTYAESAMAFERVYTSHYGPVINYALNAYDCANILIDAIEFAVNEMKTVPGRADVKRALRKIDFQGIANNHPLQWDEKGDNKHAITVLNTANETRYIEVAEIF